MHMQPISNRARHAEASLQDSRILISHELNTDVYMIPGGGIEEGESATECVIRELREESGYIIEPGRHFLTVNEYYEDCKYVSHYFSATLSARLSRA